jgi:hypothetical protein
MPPKDIPPLKPVIIVRKKRPTASTIIAPPQPVIPKAVTAKPVPPHTAPVTPPPKSVAPDPAPQSQPPPDQPTRKQREAQARSELLAVLRERWPQTFPTDFRQVRPFALGIHKDIAQALPDTNPYLIRRTIHFYQRGGKGAYWRAVLKGGSRYTLDGTPSGEVTEQEKEYAKQELARLAAWWEAKRAGQHQVRAPQAEASGTPPALDTASTGSEG